MTESRLKEISQILLSGIYRLKLREGNLSPVNSTGLNRDSKACTQARLNPEKK